MHHMTGDLGRVFRALFSSIAIEKNVKKTDRKSENHFRFENSLHSF